METCQKKKNKKRRKEMVKTGLSVNIKLNQLKCKMKLSR